MNRTRTTSNTARQNAATPSSTERRVEQSVSSEFDGVEANARMAQRRTHQAGDAPRSAERETAVSAASSQGAAGGGGLLDATGAVLDRRAMQEEADLLFALELSRTIDIDNGREGDDDGGGSGGDAGGGLGGGGRMGRAFSDGDVPPSVQRISRNLSITDGETMRALLSIGTTRTGGNQPPSPPSTQPRGRTQRSHTMYSDSGAMTSASRGRGATRFVKRL